jgi:triple functional domain protein
VMLSVPKKANDAMHLSLLEGTDVPVEKLGEVILQESFLVWDPKQIIRKARERHVFLFEQYLLFSKETGKEGGGSGSGGGGGSGSGSGSGGNNNKGALKYLYKNKLLVSEWVGAKVPEGFEIQTCRSTGWELR